MEEVIKAMEKVRDFCNKTDCGDCPILFSCASEEEKPKDWEIPKTWMK